MRRHYILVCTLLGIALGWMPMFLHGPIAEKFNVLYIRGAIAVWAWYSARMLIGFWIGISTWPPYWYVRGPLCGFLIVFPLTLVSLGMPACGFPCMFWNLTSATAVGTTVAGLAFLITGLHRAPGEDAG
jgi:hypothetical protein